MKKNNIDMADSLLDLAKIVGDFLETKNITVSEFEIRSFIGNAVIEKMKMETDSLSFIESL